MALKHREDYLVSKLREKKLGINDRTGKGLATEQVVEDELLRPFLPPAYECCKGAVVTADDPADQSEAIDRIIWDKSAASPLVFDSHHSVFPIEAVAGIVEITMALDRAKLRKDVAHMLKVMRMRERRFFVDVPGSATKMDEIKEPHLPPRAFIVGLPRDGWSADDIAKDLQQVQREQHTKPDDTHIIHGLYVLGIGFFRTYPRDESDKRTDKYDIEFWRGEDRLFRFADELRISFKRWAWPPSHSTVVAQCGVRRRFGRRCWSRLPSHSTVVAQCDSETQPLNRIADVRTYVRGSSEMLNEE